MKKGLVLIGCLLALLAGAATIQWYSAQPATSSPADSDIIALERPSPHAYKSATLAILRAYIGTNGTFVVSNLYSERTTNIYLTTTYGYFTNVYAPNITNIFLYSTNLYVTYETNQFLYTTNLFATYETNQYLYTTNLYATYETNNFLYTTNLFATYETNQYLYTTNLYATYETNLYSYTTNLYATFETNQYFYSTNVSITYLTNEYFYSTNIYATYTTNEYQYTTNLFATYNTNIFLFTTNLYESGSVFGVLNTWAGPTNTLNLSNQWEYVTYTPCAITNFLGGVSGYALDCSLAISNASSTNITITITATPSKSGDSTNIYYLPSTDVLDLGARSMHGAWVKYLSRAFH